MKQIATRYRIVHDRGRYYVEQRRWYGWRRLCDADHGWRTCKTLLEARQVVADLQQTDAVNAQPLRVVWRSWEDDE